MAEELAQRIKNGEPLLGPDERARVRVRPAMQAPGMADLAERLSDRLETRVRVQLGKRKGKVLIEFATLVDLQRICDAIGLEQRSIQLSEARVPTGDEPQVVRDGPDDDLRARSDRRLSSKRRSPVSGGGGRWLGR